MPMKKRRIQERGKQPKEAAKGSTSLQLWLQSKPAEISTPARETVRQAAGASQTTPSLGRVMEENVSNSAETQESNADVMQDEEAAAGPSGLQETQESNADVMQVEKAAAGPSGLQETQESSADVMQVEEAAAGPSGLQETQNSSADVMHVEEAAAGPSGLQTTPSPWRVKEENYSNYMGPHSHNFEVQFGPHFRTIHCDELCTLLEAIKPTKLYKKHITCADGNIIIQLGKKDKECMVATHFPCSCVEEDESLIISSEKEVVGEQLTKPIDIYPKDRYVLFKIDTVGGKYTKTKKIFRNDSVKQFKYLCVYGEKGMTVEEALKRDGRFINDLGDFYLSDNENPKLITECAQKVDNLHKKSFKVCLPRLESEKHETPLKSLRRSPRSVNRQCEPTPVSNVAQQSGISVKTALEKTGVNTEEIYKQLCQQFPELKEWMENRFPGDTYQEALNLRRENFGKIQQSFSEVYRIRKILKLGQSVCKLNVRDVCDGTGFVLFDSFILTNAHLFKGYVEGGKQLQEGVEVFALFGYEDPEPERNYSCFTAKKTFVDFDVELDYAILELNPEGQKSNQQTTNVRVPQGLLKTVGPLPQKGEACIIGHPAGGVKKMDPICIIEKEGRRQNVEDNLNPYKDTLLTLMSIHQIISNRGIDDLMMGGSKDGVVTYNTFMYHGASGSPVFDALGRVFGLHTAGYCYGFPKEESVIEYAQPVLTIFKKFVDNLRESGKMSLLERVKKVAEQNSHLKKLTQDTDSSTPMEVD